MNYLAHFYLSFGQKPLVIGNLLGDFVRGRLDHPRNSRYSLPIKQGILLHRHIDSFTDTHPVGVAFRQELPSTFGKYRGVVMDMYFDYFLAKYFEEFHRQPLPMFVADVYEILTEYRSSLPAEALPLVDSMVKYDWLYHYQFIEGMNRSFQGMSKRFPFLKGIEKAGDELALRERTYEAFFRAFFPDLISSCEDFLNQS